MPTSTNPRAPSRFRAYGPRGLRVESVDRAQRIIRGYAVITRGEALGHGLWIDSDMVDQVVAAGAAAPKGIKCRFTHPGLCSDGLGRYLGRSRNFRRDGDIARADLHFSDTTSKAPEFDKDPAEYIMDLAEKDPAAFASSIVYYPDIGEEDRFIAEHEDEQGKFVSPDPDNARDLPHARLASLVACDLVDEPAANPGGFFARGEESAVVAEQSLSWIFGLSEVAPAPEAFGGGDPARVREFVRGFLARHHIEVALPARFNKEDTMSESKTPAQPDPMQAAREQFAANLASLKAAFAADQAFAVECAGEGLTVDQAKAKYCDVLQAKLAASAGRIAELEKSAAALKVENDDIRKQLLSGVKPVAHGVEPATPSDSVAAAKAYQRENKCSFEAAYRAVTAPK